MWPLALIAGLVAASPPSDWLPGPPRALGPTTLAAVGEDGRLGVLVQGASLVTWDFDTGKAKTVARLPLPRWHLLAPAPRTEGETERALIATEKRLLLVHLRGGRRIGDWAVPAATTDRAVAWAPDGQRVALVGWELPGLSIADTTGVPVLWVDAETGTIVSQLRLPDSVTEVHGAAALPDGRSVAIGTPKRVIVLGPGPMDAHTIGIENDGVVGATRDGIVVVRKGALVVIERGGPSAKKLLEVRAAVDLAPADVAMLPGGRWAIARPPGRGAVFAIDLAGKGRVTTLSEAALGGRAMFAPTLNGLAVIGRRDLRVDLAVAPYADLLLHRLCTRGDCKSGDGALADLDTGRVYSGNFHLGQPDGAGVLRYEDGAIYTGPFVKGRPHGDGRLLTAAGDDERVHAVNGELKPY